VTWSSILVARQAGQVHGFIAKMGQDYVKRMEADSNTFRKQRGSYNEVVVKVIFSGACDYLQVSIL
jgi:hypothetical protein